MAKLTIEEKLKQLDDKVAQAKKALEYKIAAIDPDMDPTKKNELFAQIDTQVKEMRDKLIATSETYAFIKSLHAQAKEKGYSIEVALVTKDQGEYTQRVISFCDDASKGSNASIYRLGLVAYITRQVNAQDDSNKVDSHSGPHGENCDCDE